MKIKNYITNILRGLHVWAHCTVAELGMAMGVYGFYLTASESGYVAAMTFIASVIMIGMGFNSLAGVGISFFPKKCKCNGKCQEHGATKENK